MFSEFYLKQYVKLIAKAIVIGMSPEGTVEHRLNLLKDEISKG